MPNVEAANDPARIVPVNFGEHSLGKWVCASFSYTDFVSSADTLDLITIPANSFIAEMYYVPKVVWDGTPVLSVGDSSGANYMATAELTETSLTLASSMNAPNAAGSYALIGALPFYASADEIRVTLTWGSTPTAGEGALIVLIVEVPSY